MERFLTYVKPRPDITADCDIVCDGWTYFEDNSRKQFRVDGNRVEKMNAKGNWEAAPEAKAMAERELAAITRNRPNRR